MRKPIKFEWKGNHHIYYGIFFITFGIFNWFMSIDNSELTTMIPLWQLITLIGVGMFIDDLVEHTITADTPLRILYEKIIRPMLRG